MKVLAVTVAVALGGVAFADQPQLVAPERIVLGQQRSIKLEVASVPGSGELKTLVNVGKVLSVKEEGARVLLRILLPRQRSPQELLLLLHRTEGAELLYRLPLYGRTRLPVRTRPHSKLTVHVGGEQVERQMGARRMRYLRLAVPPGVKSVRVEVQDKAGLKSERVIPVKRPAYQRLLLTSRPRENSAANATFRIVVAAAEAASSSLLLQVRPKAGGPAKTLAARPAGKGRWVASFRPTEAGSYQLLARYGTHSMSLPLQAAYGYKPPKIAKGAEVGGVRRPGQGRFESGRRLWFFLGASGGLLHNVGSLFSPYIALSFGGELKMGRFGWLGLWGSVGFSWEQQEISAPGPLPPATSDVFLSPLRIGPVYRAPDWPVVPYVGVALALSYVLTKTSAPYASETSTLNLAPGVAVFGGAEVSLGRFAPFMQLGYTYARVDEDDVALLAGGVMAEIGLRLRL